MLHGLLDTWDVTALVPVSWRQRGVGSVRVPDAGGYPVQSFTYWYLPGPMGRASQGSLLYHQLRRSARISLRSEPPEVILSYWAYPDAEAAGRLAERLGVPAAMVIGGSDILVHATKAGQRERVLRAIRRHQMVFAVGDDLKGTLLEAGIPEARLRVLHRGVDRNHFYPGDRQASRRLLGVPESHRIVLWAGRMEPVKDLATLIRAIGVLPAPRRPVLALVGAGREAGRTKALAMELHVDLLMPGQVGPERLGEWYRAADLFALSSRSEGTPNVLLEASVSGLPVVTTDAGGAGSLGRRLGAPVVPIGDHEALARAIDQQLARGAKQATPDAIPSLTDASAAMSRNLMELVPRGR